MSDKYEIYEYKGAFGSDKRVLKNGKAVNEFGLLKDIQKLQAENAELKKQSQCNNISENWPLFLEWYGGYCGFDDSNLAWPVVQHSREDMRYAYQAGYEAALPTPPEGE